MRRDKEECERRKEAFERSIRKAWNGSDVPCLFDPKIAYSRQLYSLPVALEEAILRGEVPSDDIMFRRYKVLLVPIEGLFGKTSGRPVIELFDYFMRHSTMARANNNPTDEESNRGKRFPFKCIGLVQSVALPPFNKCSLSAVPPPSADQPAAQRVLTLIFDTHDQPLCSKHNFAETLRLIKLSDILSPASLRELAPVYPAYLETLAESYMQAGKLKEFPYAISLKSAPLLHFENEADLTFDAQKETLHRIAFFLEYSVQDDTLPLSFKEGWDFLRRYPTFYAYNANPKSYSRLDSKDKIRTKYQQHPLENVCVIFKDVRVGVVGGSSPT